MIISKMSMKIMDLITMIVIPVFHGNMQNRLMKEEAGSETAATASNSLLRKTEGIIIIIHRRTAIRQVRKPVPAMIETADMI